MLNISNELQNHLNLGATTLCMCWQIMRRDGVVLGFTDHDRALEFEQFKFEPDSGATGSALSSSGDLSVDNSELLGLLNSPHLRDDDLSAGRYDEAEVRIWRVNWTNTDQRVLLKSGIVGEVVREQSNFRFEVRGLSHFLDQTRGRLYQRQCDANVGDSRCGVDLSNAQFFSAGEISAVLGDNIFLADLQGGSFESDWFAQGIVHWRSGSNNGVEHFVKSNNPQLSTSNPNNGINIQSIALWQPTGLPLAVGDQFDITAGCDRRSQTCAEKFSNIINFRGFHLMPGNDFIITIPTSDETNEGGRR